MWLHAGADATARSVRAALAERSALGIDDPAIRVLLAPDRYLSGEATGIIRALEGGPSLPRFVLDPARPWSRGHAPVLVQNAETMARIGRSPCTDRPTTVPTSLVTVVSADHRAVTEVGPDVTVGDVVDGVVGLARRCTAHRGPARRVRRVLGRLERGAEPAARRRRAARRGTVPGCRARRAAGRLGVRARGVGPAPELSGRPVRPAVRPVRVRPGRGGRPRGRPRDRPAVLGRASADGRVMPEISGRGACRHPDGALRMYASALEVFAADAARPPTGSHVHPPRAGPSCRSPRRPSDDAPEPVGAGAPFGAPLSDRAG